MKRANLLAHLKLQGCYLLREGRKHSLYFNPSNGKISTIPRHREIKNFLSRKICKDLDVLIPEEK